MSTSDHKQPPATGGYRGVPDQSLGLCNCVLNPLTSEYKQRISAVFTQVCIKVHTEQLFFWFLLREESVLCYQLCKTAEANLRKCGNWTRAFPTAATGLQIQVCWWQITAAICKLQICKLQIATNKLLILILIQHPDLLIQQI